MMIGRQQTPPPLDLLSPRPDDVIITPEHIALITHSRWFYVYCTGCHDHDEYERTTSPYPGRSAVARVMQFISNHMLCGERPLWQSIAWVGSELHRLPSHCDTCAAARMLQRGHTGCVAHPPGAEVLWRDHVTYGKANRRLSKIKESIYGE